ncbi:MAG: hypothetical protein J7604_13245 [Sporocytophaga sp.]|uniref:hypothetical protein n=1 Tax=Sporocytophaga sp. TaxID=2231183 RepID=UPI001B08EE34|nr:hypothetical protein [Sporocytophaga sp.]MBO9701169.1 hypothetical protein [Sporocytophaga sp.]
MDFKKHKINPENKMAAFILMYVLFIFFAQALLKLKPENTTSTQYINEQKSIIIRTISE